MFRTFSSDSSNLYISAKVYSDFGSIIPLIRYFPVGLNWPIQHPLFPGEPIRYHFLFYAPIGFLTSLGLPLSYSLNIPSSLGFFSLLFLIYYFGRETFKSSKVGFIGVILFLFNGSLSFLDFFKNYSLFDLPYLTNFVSFRPWNSSLITAFWTLNIYTNQRHLAFSFAVCLLIVLILYHLQNRYLYLIGFLFGSLLLLNQAGFLISAVFLLYALLFYPHIRLKLSLSFMGFLPWLILYKSIFLLPEIPKFIPGFLANQPLTFLNILKFWFYNYGLSLILIIPAIYFVPKKMIFPLLSLFIIGNLFQLSPDMINNHKLFNFVFIIFGVYVANFLFRYPKLLFLFPLLILGGVIDLFPIINDKFIVINHNKDQEYFQSLPNNSVILNSTWLYHPASLSGHAIYNGYSYYTWSYGYNQEKREAQTISLYSSVSLSNLCQKLHETSITNIEISPNRETFIKPGQIFDSLIPDYQNQTSGLKVYSVSRICPKS